MLSRTVSRAYRLVVGLSLGRRHWLVAGRRGGIFARTSGLTRDRGHMPFSIRAVSCPTCTGPPATALSEA